MKISQRKALFQLVDKHSNLIRRNRDNDFIIETKDFYLSVWKYVYNRDNYSPYGALLRLEKYYKNPTDLRWFYYFTAYFLFKKMKKLYNSNVSTSNSANEINRLVTLRDDNYK